MDVAGKGHNRPAPPPRGADTNLLPQHDFVLGPVTLNASSRLLLRDTVPLALGERAVTILLLLVRQAGHLVTKEQLMAEAWGNLAVEESNLTVQISSLRRTLAAEAGGEGWIETLPRRGYRFIGPVAASATERSVPVLESPSARLPAKPSLAVLPFQNIGGDPEQEYFADGLVEDVITALSRIDWLFVIARNSSFTFKGRVVDIRQVGQALGVRYVLEGSVRRSGVRLRITAQLIDALDGSHIWASRFDSELGDVFDLQDRVAVSVAGAIEPRLRHAEIEHSRRKPTDSLGAYDYFLRALANFNKMSRQPNVEAVGHIEAAIALDPEYGAPYALGALCFALRKAAGWSENRDADIREGMRMARIAMAISPDDATTLYMSGLAHAYLGQETQQAATMMDRALTLNPNLAAAWHYSGWIQGYLGDGETAAAHFKRAMELSPLDPIMHIYFCGLAFAYFVSGDFEEGLIWNEKSLRHGPFFLPALRQRVTLLGLLGRIDEAKQLVPRLMEFEPHLRCTEVGKLVPGGPGLLARYAAGLRAAGVPE